MNQNECRCLNLGNNTLATGAVLVTNKVTTGSFNISGGTLQGTGKDLMIIQNGSQPFTIGSTIADNASPTGLTKAGLGMLVLLGNNTYSGPTSIDAGTLRVNGIYSGGGPYTVAGGASLGGTGSIAANLTVSPSGTIAPGNSVGTLVVTGSVDIEGLVSYEVSGVSSDRLTGLLGLTLGPTSVLNISAGSAAFTGATYIVADYQTLFGTFGEIDNLPSNYTISYGPGSNGSITLAPTPEPCSLALLGVGAIGLLAFAWRRRKRSAGEGHRAGSAMTGNLTCRLNRRPLGSARGRRTTFLAGFVAGVLLSPWLSSSGVAEVWTAQENEALFGYLDQSTLNVLYASQYGSGGCGPSSATNTLVYLQNAYPAIYGNKLILKAPVDQNRDGLVNYYDDWIYTAAVAGSSAATSGMGSSYFMATTTQGSHTCNYVSGETAYLENHVPNQAVYASQCAWVGS